MYGIEIIEMKVVIWHFYSPNGNNFLDLIIFDEFLNAMNLIEMLVNSLHCDGISWN